MRSTVNYCNHFMDDYMKPCTICIQIAMEQQDSTPIVTPEPPEKYNEFKRLPHGAYSKKQIPIKRELAKAKKWKVGL